METTFLQAASIEEARGFLLQRELRDNPNDTRARILTFWESVDIPSCPGSGKTTILVMKLAWAIEHWSDTSRGICVLSHTNVAKDEIKKRLTSGQVNKLLRYPHFIGTIHEFFNRFLAVPWLKTCKIPIRFVDSEMAYRKCQDAIWYGAKQEKWDKNYKMRFLAQDHKYEGRLTKLNWRLDDTGNLQLSSPVAEFAEFQWAIKEWSTRQGYHTHDDMIVFSRRLLARYANLSSMLCSRFPVVLVDEAQDTNESQASLLNEIFSPYGTVVQRFGDSDQQVFDFGDRAITDPFPNPNRIRESLKLNETQRCSPAISAAASKLSSSGLTFSSVAEKGTQGEKPYVILFDKDSIAQVIPKFAELVQNKIPKTQHGVIKAVGQIGKLGSKEAHFPYSICDYSQGFVKPGDKRVGRPKDLNEQITQTRELFLEARENFYAINVFFSGILRLLSDYLDFGYSTPYAFRTIKEQLVTEALNSNGQNGKALLQGLLNLYDVVINGEPDFDRVKSSLEELLEQTGFKQYTKSFLNPTETRSSQPPNRVAVNGVLVELNTIAGVKGETHTATLVLETFYLSHNIRDAIQAAFGTAKARSGETTQKRMKHLYVAMTRATDFLCLALPKSEYEQLCKAPLIKVWLDEVFDLEDLTLASEGKYPKPDN